MYRQKTFLLHIQYRLPAYELEICFKIPCKFFQSIIWYHSNDDVNKDQNIKFSCLKTPRKYSEKWSTKFNSKALMATREIHLPRSLNNLPSVYSWPDVPGFTRVKLWENIKIPNPFFLWKISQNMKLIMQMFLDTTA